MPHLPILVSEEEKLAYFLLPIGHPVYPILVLPPPPTHNEEGGQGKELGVRNVPLARDLATIHNRMKYKVQELCLNLHNT